MGWFKKSLLLVGGTFTAAYIYDNTFGDGITNRVIRTLSTLLLISADYKMNFGEEKDVKALHERNSQRLYDLVTTNKGLFIKIGQMIAIQGFMLPSQYHEKFRLMFDQAPEDSWKSCDATLRNELGDNYREEIFSSLEEKPMASASIAQVHRGILKENGREVAVKIQKRSVIKQVNADFMTYKLTMKLYEWIFGLPLTAFANYVCDKTSEELHFKHELSNAQKMSKLIDSDPEFKGKVYVPEYYPEISTDKVLIGEWINGDSIGEYLKLKDKGYDIKQLMETITKVYSRQVFDWGVVHCDLHPGNLLVRKMPIAPDSSTLRQQLVILDHGMYEVFSDEFRYQYSEFWKYTMERNSEKVIEVMRSWGINMDDMMLPVSGTGDVSEYKEQIHKFQEMSYYKRQVLLKKRMKTLLENLDILPMCLTFVMRSMRIVQALNRNFGSPCNRVGILVSEANRTVRLHNYRKPQSMKDYWNELNRIFTYLGMRLLTTLMFELNRISKFFVHYVMFWSSADAKDIEQVYEDEMTERGRGMGFENLPTAEDILQEPEPMGNM
ncbi:hypothetical protein FOA43_001089 [Brettanomyces nanus]|uniref:ABC1 atypical kinase-like domain-containing protein n=1 Tax=Eeniella nana TaxID=13502 RepID=A0A875S0D3_EENNA|nr:uncharacterized protein FOA43_001089 [Brettanomyces nanus]QPG73775.1 hypothetical protein FOA43_001089 [Brettanomyces nanus]